MEHLGNNNVKGFGITCNVLYNHFSQKYEANLLGGEFGNCYGFGESIKSAMISCKMRVIQLRRQKPGIFVLYNARHFSNLNGKVIEVKSINENEFMIISPIPKFDGGIIKKSDCEKMFRESEILTK